MSAGGQLHRWRVWLDSAFRDAGFGMLIISTAMFAKGGSFFPPLVDPSRRATHLLEDVVPVQVWGFVWVFLGLVALIGSVVRRAQPIALGLAVGLHFLWAMSYILWSLLGHSDRAWVTGVTYGALFALLWWGFERGKEVKVPVPVIIPADDVEE